MDQNQLEKIGLLIITWSAILALSIIAGMALHAKGMDPNAATLVGVIVGFLGKTPVDSIQAIRGYAAGAQLTKVTDQLADSTPNAAPSPQTAVAAAQQVADAATGKAADIGATITKDNANA